jgi:hypothetical protein
VNFIYLNIDDPATAALKQELKYTTQPNYILLDGQGNIVQRWAGRIQEADLRDAIAALVGS